MFYFLNNYNDTDNDNYHGFDYDNDISNDVDDESDCGCIDNDIDDYYHYNNRWWRWWWIDDDGCDDDGCDDDDDFDVDYDYDGDENVTSMMTILKSIRKRHSLAFILHINYIFTIFAVEVQREVERIYEISKSLNLVVIDCDVMNHPSQLVDCSLAPMLIYLKIEPSILEKLIKLRGTGKKHMGVQVVAATKLSQCNEVN